MSVGVMKDYKLKQRDLHASHTLGWAGDWNNHGTPQDRDEVDRREVCECDGWVSDRDTEGAPSTFNVIRNAAILARMFPIFD
jgi:hypothetical protein